MILVKVNNFNGFDLGNGEVSYVYEFPKAPEQIKDLHVASVRFQNHRNLYDFVDFSHTKGIL